jgi:hypothetical protein
MPGSVWDRCEVCGAYGVRVSSGLCARCEADLAAELEELRRRPGA